MYDIALPPGEAGRHKQKERTRARILEAALRVIDEGGEETLTMAGVADATGVTDRTVFRHFRSRDELLRSVWEAMQNAERRLPTVEALIDRSRRNFRQRGREQPSTRTRVSRRATADVAERRRALVACVSGQLPLMTADAAERRAAIADLLCNRHAVDMLKQVWGFDDAEVGEALSEAMEVLFGLRAADL